MSLNFEVLSTYQRVPWKSTIKENPNENGKCTITIFSKFFKGKSTVKKRGKSTITSRGNDDAEVLTFVHHFCL